MAGSVVAEVNDGPVLNLMNKRLRALKKKYNRIIQMEEAASQGKTLNKEQKEVLASKSAVVVLIDEYEKLRQPLSVAVQEEHESSVEDLVKFLYLGNLFDAKDQNLERGRCLTYVTDDTSNDLLGEKDLDNIATLSGLLISKPVHNGCLSHATALKSCIDHAKLLLSSSELPIQPETAVTYSGLRERVNKILSSEYLTTTPEVEAPVEVVAAAGNTVPIEHSSESLVPMTRELNFMVNHVKYEPAAIQEQGTGDGHPPPVEELAKEQLTGDGHSLPVEELAKDEPEFLNQVDATPAEQENLVDATPAQQEENKQEDENQEEEWQEQHSRRHYQNQRGGRGGRRGSSGRGGRGNRGGGVFQNPRNYNNSRERGGRGAGGHGYSNGRHAQAGVDC